MNAALWLLWVAPLTGAAYAAAGEASAWAHDALAHVDGASAALTILQSAAESARKVDNEQ